ncbi:SiaB family protein kinase [Fulvivirga maritima]|uniref:SiaB family protein kinase n=1 Tax=Fulvivirga maritima TaxID=2904247 RepID=UPI001F1A9481|nr:SiaB family protein kinase [Fulvivirga maritima]UII29332.1 SiaB family protein kinase [Fulvivirga maritima]
MKYIFDLHQTMLDHHLILVYEGEFTQEITKSVLAMAERNMDSSGEESSTKRKVFNVMVECLQNIVKHADEVDHNHAAVFMIGKHENEYIIISGNPIRRENVASLKEKLEHINSLDKDGLKGLYKDIIKSTEISDKGGAGLGFVDMARKSGQKLDFDFLEMEDGNSFFCLKSCIARS